MNKRILSEVKRNRELMGINESELDEQGFLTGVRDGIKKGFNDARDFLRDKLKKGGDEVDNDKMIKSEEVNNFLSWEMYPEYTLFFYKGLLRARITEEIEEFLRNEFGIQNPNNYRDGLMASEVHTTTGLEDGYKVRYKVPNNLIDEKLNVD